MSANREPAEQRRLLNFVLSNSTWANDTLTPVFRQSFDLIAQTTRDDPDGCGGGGEMLSPHTVW